MSKGLIRSTALVSAMTGLSRISGFIRDMILAHVFGASASFDAFVVAFRIPNFFRNLSAEGAFSQAFVPTLADYREHYSPEDMKRFIGDVTGTFGLLLLLLTIVTVVAAPVFVYIFAIGFIHDPVRADLTATMLRITFPYLMLISITALQGAILNTWGRFGVPAFTPVLLNLSMIFAGLYLAPLFHVPVYGLSYGVLLAGILQLIFQWPFLKKLHLLVWPKINFKNPGVRRVFKLMVPAVMGVSVTQIGILIDTFFASFLQTGSITWLYYSDRLIYLPLGIFGVAIATVILPHLSRQHIIQSHENFINALAWGLRNVLLIAFPSAIGLVILALPILAALFSYGEFTPHDAVMASKSIAAFAIGLPGFMCIKVLASAFYAQKRISRPVKVAIFAVICNVILNFIFIKPFGYVGLALATTISSSINAMLLAILLVRERLIIFSRDWVIYFMRLLFASVLMIALLLYFNVSTHIWFEWPAWQRILHLCWLVIGGMSIYIIGLFVSGMRIHHIRDH